MAAPSDHVCKQTRPVSKTAEMESLSPRKKRCHINFTEESNVRLIDKKCKIDEDYFENYGDVMIHEEMLQDEIRTNTYRRAILKNYDKFYKKTVMDIGAGTGILSLFCVQAGAAKGGFCCIGMTPVYAVEASDMAEQTKRIVEENNMEDKIEVINSKVEEVELEEKVDIIVSEWMGYNLLYESMLQSVIYARDRFLKKDGFIFPEKASLYIAPICDEDYIDRLKEWNNMKERYKVCMKSMIPYAKQCMARNVQIRCVPQEAIQSHKCEICSLDLRSVKISDLQNIQCSFEMKCFGHSSINGFVTWFTVEFPSAILLSTSPYEESTHWAQSVFHLSQCIDVEQDSMIYGSISLQPNSISNRFLDVVLKYRKDNQKETVQNILMDDKLI